MLVSVIAAMDYGRVIGAGGKLPWHLPADLRWFKQQTGGKPILMGRKTYESIGRPLPGRTNIVLSRQHDLHIPGALVARDLDEALHLAGAAREVVVVGGSVLYAASLPIVERMYITVVHAELAGDTWFPEFSLNDWLVDSVRHVKDDAQNAYRTSYYVMSKRRVPVRDYPPSLGLPAELRATSSARI
ncbi:MAG: dihydrofolate reductase [Myxococcales bacterium]|nr:dihydrofolate reductase [Myxococcales bacterium]